MTESALPSVPEKGLFARIIGVVTAPGETMKAVVAHPRVVGVMFIVCVVIALATTAPQMTERGRQMMLEAQVQQTERFTGQPVTDEQYQRMEQFSVYQRYIGIAAIFLLRYFYLGSE